MLFYPKREVLCVSYFPIDVYYLTVILCFIIHLPPTCIVFPSQRCYIDYIKNFRKNAGDFVL